MAMIMQRDRCIFDSIEIHIGDKKILNHKEPFLYDGGLWVPLKDLAKGLDLDYKMNKGKKNLLA